MHPLTSIKMDVDREVRLRLLGCAIGLVGVIIFDLLYAPELLAWGIGVALLVGLLYSFWPYLTQRRDDDE